MHEKNVKFSKNSKLQKTYHRAEKYHELKNSIKSFKSRLNHTKGRINNVEYRTSIITQSEEQKGKWERVKEVCGIYRIQSKETISALWKEKGAENIFKAVMTENFPNLGREMDIQIDES